jgi:hypothetical protein
MLWHFLSQLLLMIVQASWFQLSSNAFIKLKLYGHLFSSRQSAQKVNWCAPSWMVRGWEHVSQLVSPRPNSTPTCKVPCHAARGPAKKDKDKTVSAWDRDLPTPRSARRPPGMHAQGFTHDCNSSSPYQMFHSAAGRASADQMIWSAEPSKVLLFNQWQF